jgi:hypothetical protein
MSGWLVLLIAGWAVNRGLLLWVADIFHREVVGKSVQLIQWIGDEDDCHALKGFVCCFENGSQKESQLD